MHNLTVDGLHTYYVLAGTVPVLVHNCRRRESLSDNGYEWDHAETGSLLYGEIDSDGGLILLADMKNSPAGGQVIFGRMMDSLGSKVRTINGNLVDENKASLVAALAGGNTPEQATWPTWTGK